MLAAILLVAAPAAGLADTAGDRRDQPYLSTIVNQALETERTNIDIPWSNPETGHRGVLVIERTWYRDPQSPCRDYRWTLERGGRPAELINGTGCRIGPAVWRLDERPASSPLRTPDPSAPLPVPGSAPSAPASAPDPSSAPDTTAPAPTPQTAPPAQATRSAKAAPRRKPSTPAPKSQAAAAAGDATAPKPATLPSYTLPSKTAL
jgi:surface antigen